MSAKSASGQLGVQQTGATGKNKPARVTIHNPNGRLISGLSRRKDYTVPESNRPRFIAIVVELGHLRHTPAELRGFTMELNKYQSEAEATDERKRAAISVLGLVGEIGTVVSILKKRLVHGGPYPGFRDELLEELGDALWYLTSVATRYEISLEEIATKNLAKARFFSDPGEVHIFDSSFSESEQLPRNFEVMFKEETTDRSVKVKILMDGKKVGDELSDNTYDPDDYRYHDAFHFAYAAVLGWSPVTRKLLGRKRKSSPILDEVEDGGRAKIVEEAISISIFNHAQTHDFFASVEALNFTLLLTVHKMANHLEVKVCTAKQWEKSDLVRIRNVSSTA